MRNNILLVDDDQDHCELMRGMLVRLGYGVTAMTSAEEALQNAAHERYSVIVTDLSMEPMSGFEFCEKLIAQGCDAPILAVTGHANMEFAVNALRAGAYDFLAKPVDEKQLGLCVARAAASTASRAAYLRSRRETACHPKRARRGLPSLASRP